MQTPSDHHHHCLYKCLLLLFPSTTMSSYTRVSFLVSLAVSSFRNLSSIVNQIRIYYSFENYPSLLTLSRGPDSFAVFFPDSQMSMCRLTCHTDSTFLYLRHSPSPRRFPSPRGLRTIPQTRNRTHITPRWLSKTPLRTRLEWTPKNFLISSL